jgi:hypothetical protein
MPGILRIVYPNFIHYEFYVPVDANNHRYVGVMVNFVDGIQVLKFYIKYLGAIRWLFHGQFSSQDARMVGATDAPPERLYRPDLSLTAWRRLAETEFAARVEQGGANDGFGRREASRSARTRVAEASISKETEPGQSDEHE